MNDIRYTISESFIQKCKGSLNINNSYNAIVQLFGEKSLMLITIPTKIENSKITFWYVKICTKYSATIQTLKILHIKDTN